MRGAEAIFIACGVSSHCGPIMIMQLPFFPPARRTFHGVLHSVLPVALAAALFVVARPVMGQSGEGIAIGATAPAVTVADISGRTVRVAPTIGRPMLIEFWATWCEFCERLEPTMKATYSKYGSKVQFAAIAVNVNQSPRRVAKHVTDRSLKYPVYYDDSGKATDAYDVAATSFVVIIDKKGRVAYTGVGDKQDLDAAIRGVL